MKLTEPASSDHKQLGNKMKVDNNYIVLRSTTVPILVIDVEKDDLVATDSAIAVSDIYPARKKISLKAAVVMCLYALVILHMNNCGQRTAKWIHCLR